MYQETWYDRNVATYVYICIYMALGASWLSSRNTTLLQNTGWLAAVFVTWMAWCIAFLGWVRLRHPGWLPAWDWFKIGVPQALFFLHYKKKGLGHSYFETFPVVKFNSKMRLGFRHMYSQCTHEFKHESSYCLFCWGICMDSCDDSLFIQPAMDGEGDSKGSWMFVLDWSILSSYHLIIRLFWKPSWLTFLEFHEAQNSKSYIYIYTMYRDVSRLQVSTKFRSTLPSQNPERSDQHAGSELLRVLCRSRQLLSSSTGCILCLGGCGHHLYSTYIAQQHGYFIRQWAGVGTPIESQQGGCRWLHMHINPDL